MTIHYRCLFLWFYYSEEGDTIKAIAFFYGGVTKKKKVMVTIGIAFFFVVLLQ